MSIFYCDFEGGNDANAGTSFALRWKTLYQGATAARIAPGDEIRIMGSPQPQNTGVNGTFTNLSKTVTLSAALTTTIDNCEVAWTASANVTATTTATRKEGANAASLAIAAGFTTGKLAYHATGALNLSGRQQVSFWIQSNAAIAAGVLTIRLCSDTLGATTVNTIAVPAIPGAGIWQVCAVDNGAALGAAIASVALYAESDPGTVTVLLDHIIACNAPGTTGLTLASLIGKPASSGAGSDPGDVDARETWYPVQSIVGTTLLIDNGTGTLANQGRGYTGTTETVVLWKRETIKLAPGSYQGENSTLLINDFGSPGSLITFSFGWDRTNMTAQNGESWFDGQNGWPTGLQQSAFAHHTVVNKFAGVRFDYAAKFTNAEYANDWSFVALNGNTTGGWISGSNNAVGNNIIRIGHCNNNMVIGMGTNRSARESLTTVRHCDGCQQNYGLTTGQGGKVSGGTYRNNATAGVVCSGIGVIENATFANNGTGSVGSNPYFNNGWLEVYFHNCLFSDSVEFQPLISYANDFIWSHDHDQIAGYHKGFSDGVLIESETSDRHTSSGYAWKISVTGTIRDITYPAPFKLATVAVKAGELLTVKAWMKRSNAGLTAKLRLPGGQIAGIAADVDASMTATGAWEQLTITATPTAAGIVDVFAIAYGGTTYTLIVDDVEVSQS